MTAATEPDLKRPVIVGFAVIVGAVAAILLLGGWQSLNGDEVRYFSYAYSIWHDGRFTMGSAEWHALYVAATGMQRAWVPGDGITLLNGVYLPTLLSPVVAVASLGGARAITLMVGLAGLFFLLRLCARVGSTPAVLIAVGVAALSIPLLPYLHIFYMEAYLFALISAIWDRLQKADRGTAGNVLTALLILAMPFVHLRGSVVAAAFYGLLLWRLYSGGRIKFALVLAALGAAALAALVLLNLHVYGAITGPVNTARPTPPWGWFSLLAMQSFSASHGLLAYAPVWVLGMAGLIAGAVRGNALAKQGLILFAIAAITGMGKFPGGCWTARFWVQSVPMLALGLCLAIDLGRSWSMRAVAIILIAATLGNTIVFVVDPNLFLQNREFSVTYDVIHAVIGYVNFGVILPVEGDDAGNAAASRDLALGAVVMVVFLVLAMVRRRWWYAVPVLLAIAAVIDLARVSVLPPPSYTVTARRDGFDVAIRAPLRAGYLVFGRTADLWYWPPLWPHFETVTTGSGGLVVRARVAASQSIALACRDGVRALSVTGPTNFDFAASLKRHVAIYRSRSLVRRAVADMSGGC